MAENKTQKTNASVKKFLDSVADEQKRADSYVLLDMMSKATKAEPKMWGTAIVGFGDTHYVSDSGREGDWFLLGFSPRKAALTLYALGHGWNSYDAINDLGKYKLGGGCLYIKRLDDVNKPVLKKILVDAVKKGTQLNKEMAKKRKK